MTTISDVAGSIFGDRSQRGEFRQYPPDRREQIKSRDYQDWDDYKDHDVVVTTQQARQIFNCPDINAAQPNAWRTGKTKHSGVVEAMREVEIEWPELEVRFGGSLAGLSTIDTVWIHYSGADDWRRVERWLELCFCDTVDTAEHLNKSDPDVSVSSDGVTRTLDGCRNLWATTDAFNFCQNDEWGRYCHLWWDD